ncbi:MAG: FAD-binding oxidoreductase [Planctomycetales bacterium]|nr:FAD-binding oxidoreductase [Planctomycetales bacterium]
MSVEFTPSTQTELARFVSDNAVGERRTLSPVGGRTALYYGCSAEEPDTVVSLSELTRIIDYPARDMTITVESGIRIDALQATLAAERQRLPIDIAQAGRATLGGALATNTSGPRRFGYGTFRDFVIGISAVDAEGRLFKAGGRVVKNVAGYDICKLLVGSRGTIGIVSQVTLKLRPMVETSSLLWLSLPQFDDIERCLERLLTSDARPVAVEVLNPASARLIVASSRCDLPFESPVLCLGLEGSPSEVDWQIVTLIHELAPLGVKSEQRISEPEASRMWQALTEFQTCAGDPLTFQANIPPSRCMAFAAQATKLHVAVQVHAGNGIVIGQLPEEAATIEQANSILDVLRNMARFNAGISGSGNLVVLHCDSEWKALMPMCGDPEPAWPLMRQLKKAFDPHGLLNPARFVDGVEAR